MYGVIDTIYPNHKKPYWVLCEPDNQIHTFTEDKLTRRTDVDKHSKYNKTNKPWVKQNPFSGMELKYEKTIFVTPLPTTSNPSSKPIMKVLLVIGLVIGIILGLSRTDFPPIKKELNINQTTKIIKILK